MTPPLRLALRCAGWALAFELVSSPLGAVENDVAARREPDSETAEHRLEWRWQRFNIADYTLLVLASAGYLYLEFGTETPNDAGWRGGFWIDDDVRDAFVAETRAGRNGAGNWSDVLTLAPQVVALNEAIVIPLLFDAWNAEVAWQLSIINLQSLAITGILTRGGHRLTARERPDVPPCIEDPEYHELCFGGSNASFPSGHSSGAFVGAGLVCAHHLNVWLYGYPPADIAACAAMMSMATTSSVLRLVADRHYVSDVIVGTAIGLGAGFALPMLLHYRLADEPESSVVVTPVAWDGTFAIVGSGHF